MNINIISAGVHRIVMSMERIYSKKFVFAIALCMLCGLAYFSVTFALLLMVWLSPSILTLLIDSSHRCHLTAQVAMFNIMAIAKELLIIYGEKASLESIVEKALASYFTTIKIFAVSILGVGLYYAVPFVLCFVMKRYLEMKVRGLFAVIAKIKRDWNIDS